MTQEQYFDLCEQLGSEPKEEEIPLELSDFPELVQICYNVFRRLPDRWEPMSGSLLGKDTHLMLDLFRLYGIEDEEELKLAIDFMTVFENSWRTIINNKNKARASKKPAKK